MEVRALKSQLQVALTGEGSEPDVGVCLLNCTMQLLGTTASAGERDGDVISAAQSTGPCQAQEEPEIMGAAHCAGIEQAQLRTRKQFVTNGLFGLRHRARLY